jgi:Cu(I)/Ag(I) efflux system membrane protein CusA/SilA
MAAPVLGGLLIADEVIDVFLPVLYFAVSKRRWAKVHRVSLWNGRVSAGQRRQPIPAPRIVSSAGPQDRPGTS